MKISTLIIELERVKQEEGDIEVATLNTEPNRVNELYPDEWGIHVKCSSYLPQSLPMLEKVLVL